MNLQNTWLIKRSRALGEKKSAFPALNRPDTWAYVGKWRPKASCATSVKFVWLETQLRTATFYDPLCSARSSSYSPRYVASRAYVRACIPRSRVTRMVPVRRGRSPPVHRPCYFYEWLAGNVISRACNYDGVHSLTDASASPDGKLNESRDLSRARRFRSRRY